MADSSIEFELERAYERDELAAVFRTIADALAADRPLRIADRNRTATITVPPRVLAAFEVEREVDTEPPVAELELELEWDDADDSTLQIAERDSETVGIVSDDDSTSNGEEPASSDAEPTETESATDPEMATMPSDAVAGADEAAAETDESTATADETGSGRTSRFEVYEDRAEEWRWRLVHWNGNIVADSGEGYSTRSNARRAARSVMHTAPAAVIENL